MKAVLKSPRSEKKSPLSNFTVPTSEIFANLNSSLLCPTKPNPNSNLTGKISDTDYSEAETSIGSSNVDDIGRNCSYVQSIPPRGPLIDFGNKNGGVSGPVYHQKEDPEKTKDEGKQIFLPSTIYSAQKTKIKRKSSALPSGKTKDTRMVMFVPINRTPKVNTRKRNKENIEPSSCPALTKTRKKRTVSGEDGNTSISHSFTAPHGKHNKKTRQFLVEDDSVHALPVEYIEKQRAYFKEVDDFELVEEDASENDSDNEEVVKFLTQ